MADLTELELKFKQFAPHNAVKAYDVFNDRYSIDILKGISESELAIRLFASSEYAKKHDVHRGYFIWAEHGDLDDPRKNIPFGMAKGHTGGQEGVILKQDGVFHLYTYEWKKEREDSRAKKIFQDMVLTSQEAEAIAKTILMALDTCVSLIKESTLNSVADYKDFAIKITTALKGVDDERLYWSPDGEPDGLMIKYFHCSFPDKFGCWYSNEKLKKMTEILYSREDLSDSSLVMNGMLSIRALEFKTDNQTFAMFMGEQIRDDAEGNLQKMTNKEKAAIVSLFFARLPSEDERYKGMSASLSKAAEIFDYKYNTLKQNKDKFDAQYGYRVGYYQVPLEKSNKFLYEIFKKYEDYSVEQLEEMVKDILDGTTSQPADVVSTESNSAVDEMASKLSAWMENAAQAGRNKMVSLIAFGIKYGLEISENGCDYAEIMRKAGQFDNTKQYLLHGIYLSKSIKEEEYDLGLSYTDPNLNAGSSSASYDYDSVKGEGENRIFYGTPGCGKSHHVENEVLEPGLYPIVGNNTKRNVFRTTFFQDYSNTDFIGQILPRVKGNDVTYDFVPGPFSIALKCAIEHPAENVALVIEELNRGNAPSIFGDIFQLLDREGGTSKYSIVNVAIQDYLKKEIGYSLNYIKLPANLFIYATMNTSDQNVFTLDTAFKRRWNLQKLTNSFEATDYIGRKYVPGFKNVTWRDFVETINEYIVEHATTLSSEDKQIGKYFVAESILLENSDDDIDDQLDEFSYKVFEYLWNDVAKFNRKEWFISEIKTLDQLLSRLKNGENIFTSELAKKLPLSFGGQ